MAFPTQLRQSYQDLMRLRHIAQILIKNGLGFVIDQMGLNRLLTLRRRSKEAEQASSYSMPERVRLTLEELGPTFVKLGQLMSTRPDILPPQYIAELSKLLDAVPPFECEVVVETVESELEGSLDELFATFAHTPVASASIGQVHYATLKSGERVVVKVQRPHIREMIEADLGLLLRQSRFLAKHSEILRDYQIAELLEEFGIALQEELDYVREGRNADRLRQVLGDEPIVHIPRVYWELTTSKVITLEHVEGMSLAKLARVEEAGYDLPAIASVIVDIYFQQVFYAGIFHADPHPANIMLQSNQVSLVDFGLVGFVSESLKDSLRDLVIALISQNVEDITTIVLDLGASSKPPDRRLLERDIRRLLSRYYGATLESMSIGDFLEQIMNVAFKYRIRLPADLALLARTLIILEGVALRLDPTFNSVEFAKPYVRQMLRERLSFSKWSQQAERTLRSLSKLAHSLPQRSTNLLTQLEDGDLTVGLEIRRWERMVFKLDTMANRLSFSLIVAALIIGSSLIIQSGQETSTWILPWVGWAIPVPQIIFGLAGVLSLWWLLLIARSKRL